MRNECPAGFPSGQTHGKAGDTVANISVLMGIYNCADTLERAVACIVNQTYTDWELILCDDGSQDRTYAVAEELAGRYPEKIRLLRNETNRGLNYTLNRCLREATGDFIARMDGDDLCVPDRFEKELAALRAEPDIAIVSSDMEFFDESGVWGRISHPKYPVRADFLHGSPFCHAPCMVRHSAFTAVGGYTEDKRLLRVEDYHLWIKMYRAGFRGKNLPEPLYQMRDDRNAYGRRKFRYRLNEAYVRALAVRELSLSAYGYLYALRPIAVGLLPKWLYDRLHKKNLRGERKT